MQSHPDKPRSEDELNQQRDELQDHLRILGEQLIQFSRPTPITWKELEGVQHDMEDFAKKLQEAFAEAVSPESIASLEAIIRQAAEQHPPYDPQKAARRRAREDVAKKRRELRQRKGRL